MRRPSRQLRLGCYPGDPFRNWGFPPQPGFASSSGTTHVECADVSALWNSVVK